MAVTESLKLLRQVPSLEPITIDLQEQKNMEYIQPIKCNIHALLIFVEAFAANSSYLNIPPSSFFKVPFDNR